ncbi:hypothetical protein [Cohnella thermotolerans]|uniref:hypothetical protein n=1 Tax=Cohnella thermotolerans TaxID=329858 RepID=UPI001F0A2A83|nr:hypothetical protein [Cohnella thermotolerans]
MIEVADVHDPRRRWNERHRLRQKEKRIRSEPQLVSLEFGDRPLDRENAIEKRESGCNRQIE